MFEYLQFCSDGTLLEKTSVHPPMSTKIGVACNRELLREQQERALFNTMSWRLRTNLFAPLPSICSHKCASRSSAPTPFAGIGAPRLEPENAAFESGSVSGSSAGAISSAADYVLEFFDRVVPLIAHLRDPSTAAISFEDPLSPTPALRVHVHQLLNFYASTSALTSLAGGGHQQTLASANSNDVRRCLAACGDRVLPQEPYSLFVYLQI